MRPYTWQHPQWPQFRYELEPLEPQLQAFAQKVAYLNGQLTALPKEVTVELLIDLAIAEALKTSEIEAEYFSRKDVKSSIARQLGLAAEPVTDKRTLGLGQLMLSVRQTWAQPLTEEQLFAWHLMLLGHERRLEVGRWRSHAEPMQIVSGAMGKEVVHFEAPPSARVPEEMQRFLDWFNASNQKLSGAQLAPVRAALAHLHFETVHPFEDGNGRIGRAVAEKALSQGLGRPAVLCLSKAIEADRHGYYEALQQAQFNLEVTPWLTWFVKTMLTAQEMAQEMVNFVIQKARFLELHGSRLNERQRRVINRMLEEGPEGFEGGMNTRKYVGLTKAGQATAYRDMLELVTMGAFRQSEAGGRSTSYFLVLPELDVNFPF